jgi:DNA-binding transcriptional ArsR family regulator
MSLISLGEVIDYISVRLYDVLMTQSQPDIYFAIADLTRRQILMLILDQERSVSDLVNQFEISQPAISQHLRILRSSGIVKVRKHGRQRLYQVDFQRLKGIHDWISQFEDYWESKLDALEELIENES